MVIGYLSVIITFSGLAPQRGWAQEGDSTDDGASAPAPNESSSTDQSEPAEQRGNHCLDEPRQKLVLHQLAGGQYNPWGLENTMRFGYCIPLIERPHILFDYTHLEIGIVDILSPVYNHVGAYFQIAPISLIQFRLEVMNIGHWTFFFDRAGYYGVDGYDADYRNVALPAEQAGYAEGWNVNFVTTLQARVALGPVAIVLSSILNVEYWSLGTEEFYVNLKRDVIMARSDWVVANEAILCLELPVRDRFIIRVGAFDTTRYVLESGTVSNLVGGMLMFNFPVSRSGTVRNLTPFVRVGGYTNHPFRAGEVGAQVAVMVSYDLFSPGRQRR
jgi:hypothetical protein